MEKAKPQLSPLGLRLTVAQRQILERAAESEGLNVSAWIRRVALIAARRQQAESNGSFKRSRN